MDENKQKEELKQMGAGMLQNNGVCPHCGYCPTCGRPYGNWNYPYYPQPIPMPTYPHQVWYSCCAGEVKQ